MKMIFPIGPRLTLKITNNSVNQPGYPSSRLQKGLLLMDNGQELAEEGVGFGVPVLMRGFQTIFPGSIQLDASEAGPLQVVRAIYSLNLEEKIGKPTYKGIESRLLYAVKNYLAALIRSMPFMRGLLTGISSFSRKLFGWETLYEHSEFSAEVKITYRIDQRDGVVDVALDKLDLSTSGITEVVVMNEQGARTFDRFIDSIGNSLQGNEIGCWDEIVAQAASFISSSNAVAFSLEQVAGAKLYRGRELIGSRLSWAGFGYSFPAQFDHFRYQVKIGRIV
jgi:hypothetical protein